MRTVTHIYIRLRFYAYAAQAYKKTTYQSRLANIKFFGFLMLQKSKNQKKQMPNFFCY